MSRLRGSSSRRHQWGILTTALFLGGLLGEAMAGPPPMDLRTPLRRTTFSARRRAVRPHLSTFSTAGKDVELAKLFETFATIGKFNVIVAPTVRGRFNLDVSGVPPLSAMKMVAKVHGLSIREMKEPGARKTYLIAPQALIEHAYPSTQTQILKLRYQDVATVLPTLSGLLKAYDVEVRGLEQQNTLIIQGPQDGLAEAVDIINYLDLPNANLTLHLMVFRDEKQTWFTTVEAQNGHPVKAIVGPEDSPGSSALQYLSVELLPRVSPDNTIQIETDVKLSPPGGLTSTNRHLYNQLSTSTRFQAGETVRLASMVSPTGQILTFRVRVERTHAEAASDESPAGGPPEGPPLPASDIGEDADVELGGTGSVESILPEMPAYPEFPVFPEDLEIPDLEL